MACASPVGHVKRPKRCRRGMALARVACRPPVPGAKVRILRRPNPPGRRLPRHRHKKTCSLGLVHPNSEKRLQRQQTIPAKQTVRGLRPHHDLAQVLVQELGFGPLLLRKMSLQEDHRKTQPPSIVKSLHAPREDSESKLLTFSRKTPHCAPGFHRPSQASVPSVLKDFSPPQDLLLPCGNLVRKRRPVPEFQFIYYHYASKRRPD